MTPTSVHLTRFVLLAALVGNAAVAQGVGTTEVSSSASLIAAEKAKIVVERNALEAGFSRENSACYQRFWVNDCLFDVKNRRREALSDLQRREVSLNDQDRKAKAAEQVRKTDDKASPENQQSKANQRADAQRDFAAKQQRELDAQADRATRKANEKSSQEDAANRLKNNLSSAEARADKKSRAAQETQKHQDRLDKAEQRRLRIERDRAAQTKPPAQSLPVPP